jgi:hypothetical protein
MALKKLIACSVLGLLIIFPLMAQTPEEIEQEIQDEIAAIDELKPGLFSGSSSSIDTTVISVGNVATNTGHSRVRVHAVVTLSYLTGGHASYYATVSRTISVLSTLCGKDDVCAALAVQALGLTYGRFTSSCEKQATDAILDVVKTIPTATVKREASKALGLGVRNGSYYSVIDGASAALSKVQKIKTIYLNKKDETAGEWKIVVEGEPVSFAKKEE